MRYSNLTRSRGSHPGWMVTWVGPPTAGRRPTPPRHCRQSRVRRRSRAPVAAWWPVVPELRPRFGVRRVGREVSTRFRRQVRHCCRLPGQLPAHHIRLPYGHSSSRRRATRPPSDGTTDSVDCSTSTSRSGDVCDVSSTHRESRPVVLFGKDLSVHPAAQDLRRSQRDPQASPNTCTLISASLSSTSSASSRIKATPDTVASGRPSYSATSCCS
jgi:hypothetical protein